MPKKTTTVGISILPPEAQISESKKVPQFEPHDLQSLVDEAKSTGAFVVEVLRRRNEDQLRTLVEHLGVSPADPEVWKKAFFLLAVKTSGVDHVKWSPRRTNKNAVKWTVTHDLALLKEVTILCAKGLSERAAIDKIAADPAMKKILPYRENGQSSSKKKRVTALLRRLHRLKPPMETWLHQALCIPPKFSSSIEEDIYHLEMSHGLSQLVTNEQPLKKVNS